MYIFGGASDKDRLYFIKYHPQASETVQKNTQLFFNTIVPEIFDSLVSSAEKFKTELQEYLSGYDSEESKFVVEYVKPENTNLFYLSQINGHKKDSVRELLALGPVMIFQIEYEVLHHKSILGAHLV